MSMYHRKSTEMNAYTASQQPQRRQQDEADVYECVSLT